MEEAGCANVALGRELAPDGHMGGQLPMAAALSGEAPRPPEDGPEPPGCAGEVGSLAQAAMWKGRVKEEGGVSRDKCCR